MISSAHTSVLSVLLPTPDDTVLLRACLDKGESGREACESWFGSHDNPKRDLNREFVKSLVPLMSRAVRTHSVQVNDTFLTVLRTGALREELRTRTYRHICQRMLSALVAEGIPTIVIKGAAIAETVYPHPAVRHSHNIELLVEPQRLDEIVGLLVPLKFVPSPKIRTATRQSIELTHESGLPAVLHCDPFQIPLCNAAVPKMFSRTVGAQISDTPVQVLSPSDALLLSCANEACSGVIESNRSIIDAWFIVDQYRDLDWDLLLQTAHESHLELPLWKRLSYLFHELKSPIPPQFLDRLSTTVRSVSALDWELAMFTACRSTRGSLRNLICEGKTWRSGFHVVKWSLLPSATYMLSVTQVRSSWLLPISYFSRPIHYISSRLRPRFVNFRAR
jgi:Uncharacterised nucleotidyltransferase